MINLEKYSDHAALIGRLFFASMFLMFGYSKVTGYGGTVGYMGSLGLLCWLSRLRLPVAC